MTLISQLAAETAAPEPSGPIPSLAIQLVVYRDSYARLLRTLQSVATAAHRARLRGAIGEIAVLIGDSSDSPCLEDPEINALRRQIEAIDGEFAYTFFGENLGSAGGSNRLAALHSADLLFVLNPDTYLHPQAVHRLVAALQSDVGISEGRQLPMEHPKAHDPLSGDTSWSSGACTLVRRDAFDAVRGFDTTHFFLHCDDVDFSWRIRAEGWRVVHVPDALVYHDKRLNLRGRIQTPGFEQFHGMLGRLMLIARYDPSQLDSVITATTATDNPYHERALAEFRRRRDDGRVPDPMPSEDSTRVAQFIDGNFAKHRF